MIYRLSAKPMQFRCAAAALLLIGYTYLPSLAQMSKPSGGKCKQGTKIAACANTPDAVPQSSGGGTAPASAGESFPFPTEDSKHGGGVAGDASPAPASGVPSMPTSGVPDPPASSERPLNLPPGYSGSSSSSSDDAPATGSSSSRSADDDDVAPTIAAPDAPIRSSALKDLGSRGDTSAARAKLEKSRVVDDLKVGGFYMKNGNTQGAYLRFKDAADHAPEEPDVHFSLAEAAGKLNKRDEAILNYREYLRLDPGGDHDKASRTALSKLGSTAQ